MKLLGNLIWLVFGGFISAVVWAFAGLIAAITIIGIPFAKQFFKLASVMLTPFGTKVDIEFSKYPILNILWAIFVGWELALVYIGAAFFSAITIIGIPFSIQWLKLTRLALFPFGAKLN